MSRARSLLLAAIFSVVCLIAACGSTSSPTVAVPDAAKGDSTLPGSLTLQADVPGRPFGNAFLEGAASTMELGEPGSFTVTALASDMDGGIRELRIFSDVTLTRGSRSRGPACRADQLR